MHIETDAVHAAREIDKNTGAITPALHLATTFLRGADGGYPTGYSYSRAGNPTRDQLETGIAALERGRVGLAFGSGQAATSSVFLSLRPGDHVVAPRDVYHGTRTLIEEVLVPWGVERSYADLHVPGEAALAMTDRTRLVWVETPANPSLRVTSIADVSAAAHARGALCACDNTFATPILQRPIEHGADAVVHSLTKWISGHSDSVGGAVVCARDDEFAARVRTVQVLVGGVCAPFDSWLSARGLPTLAVRVRQASDTALLLARELRRHPQVESVHYPGLEDHPEHGLASSQMEGFGGILSFCVRGDRERAMRVAAELRTFTMATSLGGVESLVEHRQSIEGPRTTTPANLLRLSIGMEHASDLIQDLDRALGL